ncbi:MAG: hypothetical protein ABIT71_06090 [Vicinamibacteraceae bacterium]
MSACFASTNKDGYGWMQIRLIGDGGRQIVWFTTYTSSFHYVCPMDLTNVVADRVLAVGVESYNPIAIARELQGRVYFGSHGAVAPSRTWHFAEGPSTRPVDVFLLAYNPGDTPVTATYTYYRAAGDAPSTTERTLPPGRTTVWVNADEPRLAGADYAVSVTANAPILVDRGLRWHPPGRTAPQESVQNGTATPSAEWYFPHLEAYKQSEERLVLANPGDQAAELEIAVYLTNAGPRVLRQTVAARSRMALRTADFGVDAAAGVRIVSTNGVRLVAEHTQEGLGAAAGRWAVAAPGATAATRTWAVPTTHVERGNRLVLFNPSDTEATVGIDGNHYSGYFDLETSTRFSFKVPPRRLRIIDIDALENPATRGYGGIRSAIVRSLPDDKGIAGPNIVVARTGPAGALDVAVARVETFIATRVD